MKASDLFVKYLEKFRAELHDKLNEDLQQELCHLIPELADHKHNHGGNP